MSRRPALIFLLLAGCSKGVEADLQYIGEARSLAAEWALVNEQAALGKLNETYTTSMRSDLRKQLEATAASLNQPDSPYGSEIRTLIAQPDDARAQKLRAHAERLKQIEDRLESA